MRFVSPETELPQGRKLFYKGQGDSFGEHEVLTAVPRTWEKCCEPSLAKCSPSLGVKAIQKLVLRSSGKRSCVQAAGPIPPNLSDQALAG